MIELIAPLLRKQSRIGIGLISGTSADGIDAVLVRLTGCGPGTQVETLAFSSDPWPGDLRARILACYDGHVSDVCRLNVDTAASLADAAIRIAESAEMEIGGVDFIASHGQTIWHEPRAEERGAATLQIGDGDIIAERTGCFTISDMRMRDIAAGGEGAPLVSYTDQLLFSEPGRRRVLVNLGGIANLTLVDADKPESLIAFDTGPANSLMDYAAALAQPETGYDRGGELAKSGVINEALLTELLSDSYFDMQPPKSTGRERFGQALFQTIREKHSEISASDLCATFTELSARTLVEAIERFVGEPVHDVIVAGGGAHNPVLMSSIGEKLSRMTSPPVLQTSDDYGIDIDAKEAIAFAVMGNETLHARPGNLPAATGARRAVPLGKISLP